MNRRTLLRRGAAATLASAAGVVGYTLGIEPHWLEIVERELPIAGLPAELRGRTLAQLSDLHCGPQVSEGYLVSSLERVRALEPDIVALSGDYITHTDGDAPSSFARLRDVLAHLPRGRLATVGVLGNHDYGLNWSEVAVGRGVAAELERAGVHVLRNDAALVAGLDLVGVDDLWARRADPRNALAKRTGSAALALCHNPDAQDELPWPDYSGWILAGHTHGGQCKPPFLPAPLLSVRNRRYARGEVVVDERRTLYINRGIGHLIRARFNARPEITLFTLVSTA